MLFATLLAAALITTAVAATVLFSSRSPFRIKLLLDQEPRASATDTPTILPPSPGLVDERELAGEECHRYQLALRPGQFLELAATQLGTDVAVALYDPAGRRLLEVDSPNGSRGTESLVALAEVAGDHRVEVRALAGSPTGRYRLELVALRRADERDRLRAVAGRLFDRGERQRRQGGRQAWQQALDAYGQAIGLWRAAADPRAEALALHRSGQTHEQRGECEAALASYLAGIELYHRLGSAREEAVLLNRAGNLYRQSSRYDEARAAFRRARDIFTELRDRTAEAWMGNNIARVHYQADHVQAAIRTYQRALAIWRDLGNIAEEAATRTSIAKALLAAGQLERARDQLEQALALRRAAVDLDGEANTRMSLGTVFRRTGDLPRAGDHLKRALELERRLGHRDHEAVALIGLGLTALESGEHARALDTLGQALRLARALGERRTEAYALLNSGVILQRTGRPEQALNRLRLALEILRDLDDRRGQASTIYVMALAERDRGALQMALARVASSLERVEGLRSDAESETLRISFLASRRDYYELHVDLLMELARREPGAGHEMQALLASERGRARAFLDTLQQPLKVTAARDDSMRALHDELIAKETERIQLLGAADSGPRLERLDREIRGLTLAFHELRAQRREETLDAAAPPLTPATIRELATEDNLLLVYALGDRRSFLWTLDGEGLESHVLPSRGRLEELARRAHSLLSENYKRGLQTQTRLVLAALGEALLAPAADRLAAPGVKRLVIVADGALQYLPFAALPHPAPRCQSRLIVQEHEVVSLPSLAVWPQLQRMVSDRGSGTRGVAVIADPLFEGSERGSVPPDALGTRFRPLPFTRIEAEAICSLVPRGACLKALGADADLDLVRHGNLARYAIVHFATHGWLDTEHPELSGLLLSTVDDQGRPRPGLLQAHEIRALDLPAEIVVLSACRTALGREVRGEGLLSLTRSFMDAGAARVLVSLWAVEDRATTELMRHFYRHLLTGERAPADALRQAQLALLASQSWHETYYWAGFVLQGLW